MSDTNKAAVKPNELRPESAIQAPSSDCGQDSGYWHALDDASTEVEVSEFVGALVRALQPDLVVECGTYHGQTTAAIGRAQLANGHGQAVGLETDRFRAMIAEGQCALMRVEIIQADAATWTSPIPIDLAWIDSGDPADREPVIRNMLAQLSARGLLAIHDSGTQWALRGILHDMVAAGLVHCILLPTPRGVCLARPGPAPAWHPLVDRGGKRAGRLAPDA